METYHLQQDLYLLCHTAKSFPGGILEAQQALDQKIAGDDTKRRYFGISWPNELGTITYKAAVEGNQVEAQKFQCESFVLKKGTYICIRILNFKEDIAQIGQAFQKLIADPTIDPQGCCVELYENDTDVLCMVRLSSE